MVGEANRDAEFRNLVDELLGAIQRIDDPNPLLAQALLAVDGFLGEPSVIGKGVGENRLDGTVSFGIGNGDRVIFSLRSDLVLGAVVAQQDFSRCQRCLARVFNFAGQIQLACYSTFY